MAASSFDIWYDPFYHGSFKFKAKLGLGTVLLTSSYHSDSKNGSCNKLFTNWVFVPYQEIQALGFPNSPRKLGLYEKPWACISWYGPCTQLVNSKYQRYGHFSRSIQLGPVTLLVGSGQSSGGGQGCKAPRSSENAAFCSTKKRPKHLCAVFLVLWRQLYGCVTCNWLTDLDYRKCKPSFSVFQSEFLGTN